MRDPLILIVGIAAILAYGALHVHRHVSGHSHEPQTASSGSAVDDASRAEAPVGVPTDTDSVSVRIFTDRAEPGEIAARPGQRIVFISEEGVHDMAEGEGNAEAHAHTHDYGAQHSGEIRPGERYETVYRDRVRYYHDHLNPNIFVKVNMIE